MPTNAICVITSCPALRAVRDGSFVRPNHRPADNPRNSLLYLMRNLIRKPVSTFRDCALFYHVRQQTEEARALDRLCELTLFLRRYRGDPARHDLAALGDVALQQLHVLVVDLRRIRPRKRAALAPAEERAASAALR